MPFLKLSSQRLADIFRQALFLCLTLAGLSGDALALCTGEDYRAEQIAKRIGDEWPVRIAGDPVSAYLQRLGDRLVPRQDIWVPQTYFTYDWPSQWRFRAVRDLSANAFSIGDGRTYVTDGAILAAENEMELAAVLAHEIGHQLATHFCSASDNEGLGRSVGSLHQVIDIGREKQADRLALEILQEAGWPPHAMYDVVRKMPDGGPDARWQRLRMQALIEQLGGFQSFGVPNSPEFHDVKQFLHGRP